jgi:pilus assembly protein Flp/PilA
VHFLQVQDLRPKGQAVQNLPAKFIKNDSGAAAIEYAVILAGIAAMIIVVVQNLGSTLNTTYTSVATAR